MMAASWGQILLYLALLLVLGKALGEYMARVYEGRRTFLTRLVEPLEKLLYRLAGAQAMVEMNWRGYAVAVLLFNLAGLLVVFLLQRLQGHLPWNPEGLPGVSPDLALNTAVSFATNTQMLGLTVQNFLSAATGMAVLVALIRGLTRHTTQGIGNFWTDFTRTTLYILLPLALMLAPALVSQGVVQTLRPYGKVTLQQPLSHEGETVTQQTLALGPAASQVAIKQTSARTRLTRSKTRRPCPTCFSVWPF